jgi:hypothetical protein
MKTTRMLFLKLITMIALFLGMFSQAYAQERREFYKAVSSLTVGTTTPPIPI